MDTDHVYGCPKTPSPKSSFFCKDHTNETYSGNILPETEENTSESGCNKGFNRRKAHTSGVAIAVRYFRLVEETSDRFLS